MFFSRNLEGSEVNELLTQNKSSADALLEGALVGLEVNFSQNEFVQKMVKKLRAEIKEGNLGADVPSFQHATDEDIAYTFGYHRVRDRRPIDQEPVENLVRVLEEPVKNLEARIFLQNAALGALLAHRDVPEFQRLSIPSVAALLGRKDEVEIEDSDLHKMQHQLWLSLFYAYIDVIGREAIVSGDIQHFLTGNITIADRPSKIIAEGAQLLGIPQEEALASLPRDIFDIGVKDVRDILHRDNVKHLFLHPSMERIKEHLEEYINTTATKGIGLFVYERAICSRTLGSPNSKLSKDFDISVVGQTIRDINEPVVRQILSLGYISAKLRGIL